MVWRDYELDTTVSGSKLRIRARGRAVLSNPMTNRGTAFTDEERTALIFPGLGLGVAACGATRVTEGMIAAAAAALSGRDKSQGR